MPAAVEFEYDAFISYASEDRPWAARLHESLTEKGLRVFLDQQGLRVGEEWQPQLLDALERSRHLILLWSSHSHQSAWVDEETVRFRVFLGDGERRQQQSDRKVVQILLDGEYRRMPAHQGIGALRDEGVYDGGAGGVPNALWASVVESVDDAIRGADDSLPVPVLVLASTAQRISAVDADREPDGGGLAMNQLLQLLGTDRRELLEHYGPGRTDWRPFGSDRSVRDILDGLKDALNKRLEQDGLRRFSWRYLDEAAFWERTDDGTDAEVVRLEARPALIVVDPLSFYDGLVASRYSNFLQPRFFSDPDTFILVLAPFSLPQQAAAVRDTIRLMAWQVFMHYYEPPVFAGARYARCGANVGDEMDFKGWLMSTIGPYVASGPMPAQPAVLRAGAG